MVLELNILLLKEMEARSTTKINKFKYDKVVFYELLQGFEEYKIHTKEMEKLLRFLKEWYEDKICKKRGKIWEPRSYPHMRPHKRLKYCSRFIVG